MTSCSHLLLGLVSNSFLASLELLFIEQVVVLKRLHVLIELEDERAGRGDVVGKNLLLAHAGKVLDDGTKRVAVGNDNNALARDDLWADSVIPVGQDAINSDLERLSLGKHIGWQIAISALEAWMPLILEVELGRGDVVGATPLEDLLLAVLLGSLGLVKALKSTIVALIESPCLVVRDPKGAHLFHHRVVGLDGACQH